MSKMSPLNEHLMNRTLTPKDHLRRVRLALGMLQHEIRTFDNMPLETSESLYELLNELVSEVEVKMKGEKE